MKQLTEQEYKQGVKGWVDRLFKYIYPASKEKELSKDEKDFRDLWKKYIDSALLSYHVKLGVCQDSMMGALSVMRDTAMKLRDDDMWCYKPIASKYCTILDERIKKEQTAYRQNKYGIVTYYNVLGVSEKASAEEIKSAYLKRIDEVNKGTSTYQFDVIHVAYNKLSTERYLYDAEIAKKRKSLHYDAAEDVEIVAQKKVDTSSAYKSWPPREAREDEKNEGDDYIIALCLICIGAIVIGLLAYMSEGSLVDKIFSLKTLIYVCMFGVFTRHCSGIAKNFKGASMKVRDMYGVLGVVGSVAYVATMIWSFWHYEWWMILFAGLFAFVLGRITSAIFQKNIVGMMLSIILILLFAGLSIVGLIWP